jgi:hypothetical protein
MSCSEEVAVASGSAVDHVEGAAPANEEPMRLAAEAYLTWYVSGFDIRNVVVPLPVFSVGPACMQCFLFLAVGRSLCKFPRAVRFGSVSMHKREAWCTLNTSVGVRCARAACLGVYVVHAWLVLFCTHSGG